MKGRPIKSGDPRRRRGSAQDHQASMKGRPVKSGDHRREPLVYGRDWEPGGRAARSGAATAATDGLPRNFYLPR